ncbi:hypothetical protein E1B28_012113 [Marasmius oreades]|uniref:Gag-like protein n=1 Tax=Marasmius oreades TaxID=181124 RepID=A0A9P7UMW4_9AGAR|nr:uncharacterized protein E1B28_012113 [Marasmius oreades]KAG7088082.1 hypothetical protein E1B28_012113 [Marasmius oreades]
MASSSRSRTPNGRTKSTGHKPKEAQGTKPASAGFFEQMTRSVIRSPSKLTGRKRDRDKDDTGGRSPSKAPADNMNSTEFRMDSPTPTNVGQTPEEDSILEDDEGSLLNTDQEAARRMQYDNTPTPHQHFDDLENIVLGTASDIQGELGIILSWVQNMAAALQETNESIKTLITNNSKLQREVTALKEQNNEIKATQNRVLEEVNVLKTRNAELVQVISPPRGTQNSPQSHGNTTTNPKTTTALGPTYRPTLPTKAPTTKAASRPTDAHHPSRLVVRFANTGIKEEDKEEPQSLAKRLNHNITAHAHFGNLADPPTVVAVNYNRTNSSLIVYMREDQAAADLLPYEDVIRECVLRDNLSYKLKIYVDKKWFKIQVDNVPTMDFYGNIHTPANLMAELTRNNSTVYKLHQEEHVTMEPRWVRTMEDIMAQGTRRSSFIFGTDSEESANKIINSKSLAVFGRYCDIRPFQDRPPVRQCDNCWNLGHHRKSCTGGVTCRLCASKEHSEKTHTDACTKCRAHRESEGYMDTEQLYCDHDLRCTNCVAAGKEDTDHATNSRRCPIRLEAFGTARTNEKAAIKRGTLYQVATQKRSRKPRTKTNKPNTAKAASTINVSGTNRFAALGDINMETYSDHPTTPIPSQ